MPLWPTTTTTTTTTMSFSNVFSFPDADLILRPTHDAKNSSYTDAVEFRVHRCILSAASPFFESMLSLPQPRAANDSSMPVIPFVESAFVLEILLRYIYPMPDPVIESLDEVGLALEAARKYDVTVATDGLRRLLVTPDFSIKTPLGVYAIASRYDLEEEMQIAARATLSRGLYGQPLHDDLKAMNGYAYHNLLLMHEQRANAAIALLWLPDEVRCMLCNGRRNLDEPPRWWVDFKARAKEELRLRPTSAVIFTLGFLQQSVVAAGCERCAGSIMASFWFFDQLKQKIDALPTAV